MEIISCTTIKQTLFQVVQTADKYLKTAMSDHAVVITNIRWDNKKWEQIEEKQTRKKGEKDKIK